MYGNPDSTPDTRDRTSSFMDKDSATHIAVPVQTQATGPLIVEKPRLYQPGGESEFGLERSGVCIPYVDAAVEAGGGHRVAIRGDGDGEYFSGRSGQYSLESAARAPDSDGGIPAAAHDSGTV